MSYDNLKYLAENIHGKGSTIDMLNRWAEFEAACKPELILELIQNANRYLILRNTDAELGVSIVNIGEWTSGATCIALTYPDGESIDAAVDAQIVLQRTVNL